MAVGSLPVLGLALSRPAAASVVCAATKEEKEQDIQEKAAEQSPENDADTVARKFGLEAGLWKVCSLLLLLHQDLGQLSEGLLRYIVLYSAFK